MSIVSESIPSPLQSAIALLESHGLPVTTADRIAATEDAEEQRQMEALEWACNSEE
jgi:hypothetical protein